MFHKKKLEMKSIDDKELIREKALRSSRDIIINCRKAIQLIHQNKKKDAQKNIKQASSRLGELYTITKNTQKNL